ncbi:MAG TPA: hypothetical protein VHZ27_17280 [Solirubrobacteraceae bacterium]|jgi:hypothetical protein|nr:hypothetical protein [Solirubrobacteraceae bacterium]
MRASFTAQPPAFPRRIAPADGVRLGAQLGDPATDPARNQA